MSRLPLTSALTGALGLVAFLLDPTLHVASKALLAKLLSRERRFPEKSTGTPFQARLTLDNSTIELSRIPLTYSQFDSERSSRVPRVDGNNNLRLL